MLGVLRGRVNEDGIPIDAGKGKCPDFRLSQALAYAVVRKGSNFESVFCGLSPKYESRPAA